MKMRKLFFILTVAAALILTSCSGPGDSETFGGGDGGGGGIFSSSGRDGGGGMFGSGGNNGGGGMFGGGGGGGGNIYIDPAIRGTWKGDEYDGTLVFTANSISSPDDDTQAVGIAIALNLFIAGGKIGAALESGYTWSLTIRGGNIVWNTTNDPERLIFTYTVVGNTLTIYGDGTPEFVGTKQ